MLRENKNGKTTFCFYPGDLRATCYDNLEEMCEDLAPALSEHGVDNYNLNVGPEILILTLATPDAVDAEDALACMEVL